MKVAIQLDLKLIFLERSIFQNLEDGEGVLVVTIAES